MSEISGGQMTLDVGNNSKPPLGEPSINSAEKKHFFEGATRDPNIPVQLEGMAEPKTIPVRLTIYNPDFQDFIGPFYEPKGKIALYFWGVESDFNNHHYWSGEIKEALKDPRTGKRNRLDQKFVKTHKGESWYVQSSEVMLNTTPSKP